jgi:hypothetical protein
MTRLKVMLKLSAPLLVLAIAGCSVSANTTIDPGTLTGSVAGQTWTLKTGSTSAFLSEGQDTFFAELYDSQFTPCGSPPNGAHLIVAIPKAVGDYPMSLSRNMTFYDGHTNLIATDGRIVVDAVTTTHVTGGLVGTYDSNNEVSGHFDLTICAN